jgi:hypothetical protein
MDLSFIAGSKAKDETRILSNMRRQQGYMRECKDK